MHWCGKGGNIVHLSSVLTLIALLFSAGCGIKGKIEFFKDRTVCQSGVGIIKLLPLLNGGIYHCDRCLAINVTVVRAAKIASRIIKHAARAHAVGVTLMEIGMMAFAMAAWISEMNFLAIPVFGCCIFVSVIQSVSSFLLSSWAALIYSICSFKNVDKQEAVAF